MKKLVIILIILSGLGIAGFYMSYTIVNDGETAFIKTKFRPYAEYPSGTYYFPEKILFYAPKAFVRHDLHDKSFNISVPITFDLPKLRLFKEKEADKVEYKLALKYQMNRNYQKAALLEGATSLSQFETSFKKTFEGWLQNRDRHIVESLIRSRLSENQSIDIDEIFNLTTEKLYQEIMGQYKNEEITVQMDQITHSRTDSLDLNTYLDRYQKAREYDKERFAKELEEQKVTLSEEAKYKKEELKRQAVWNLEKEKVKHHVEQLKMYGQLFKEYPEALNYLYLKKLSDKVNILVAPKDTKSLFAPLFPSKLRKSPTLDSPGELKKNTIKKRQAPSKELVRKSLTCELPRKQ
mgnify:CR=1 FL=1